MTTTASLSVVIETGQAQQGAQSVAGSLASVRNAARTAMEQVKALNGALALNTSGLQTGVSTAVQSLSGLRSAVTQTQQAISSLNTALRLDPAGIQRGIDGGLNSLSSLRAAFSATQQATASLNQSLSLNLQNMTAQVNAATAAMSNAAAQAGNVRAPVAPPPGAPAPTTGPVSRPTPTQARAPGYGTPMPSLTAGIQQDTGMLARLSSAFQSVTAGSLSAFRSGIQGGQRALADFGAAVSQAHSSLGTLESSVFTVGNAVKGLIAGMALKDIADTGAKFENLHATLNTVAGSAQGGQQAFNDLWEQADRLGITVNELTGQYSHFLISAQERGFTLKESEGLFFNLAEAMKALHIPTTDMAGAFLAFSQMMDRGKVSGQEMLQLVNRLPGATSLVKEALGNPANFQDMIAKGAINPEQMMIRLAELIQQKYPTTTQSVRTFTSEVSRLSNEWEKFKNTIAEAGFLDGLSEAARKLSGALKSDEVRAFAEELGQKLGNAAEHAGEAILWIRDHVDALALAFKGFIAVQITSTLMNIGSTAITVATSFARLSMLVAANPWVLLATAVAGVALEFARLYEKTGSLSGAFDDMKTEAGDAIDYIQGKVAGLREKMDELSKNHDSNTAGGFFGSIVREAGELEKIKPWEGMINGVDDFIAQLPAKFAKLKQVKIPGLEIDFGEVLNRVDTLLGQLSQKFKTWANIQQGDGFLASAFKIGEAVLQPWFQAYDSLTRKAYESATQIKAADFGIDLEKLNSNLTAAASNFLAWAGTTATKVTDALKIAADKILPTGEDFSRILESLLSSARSWMVEAGRVLHIDADSFLPTPEDIINGLVKIGQSILGWVADMGAAIKQMWQGAATPPADLMNAPRIQINGQQSAPTPQLSREDSVKAWGFGKDVGDLAGGDSASVALRNSVSNSLGAVKFPMFTAMADDTEKNPFRSGMFSFEKGNKVAGGLGLPKKKGWKQPGTQKEKKGISPEEQLANLLKERQAEISDLNDIAKAYEGDPADIEKATEALEKTKAMNAVSDKIKAVPGATSKLETMFSQLVAAKKNKAVNEAVFGEKEDIRSAEEYVTALKKGPDALREWETQEKARQTAIKLGVLGDEQQRKKIEQVTAALEKANKAKQDAIELQKLQNKENAAYRDAHISMMPEGEEKDVAIARAQAQDENKAAGRSDDDPVSKENIRVAESAARITAQANMANDALYKMATQNRPLISDLRDVVARFGDNMTDALTGIVLGTTTVKEAFRNLAMSIAQDLARVAIQRAIVAPIMGMFNMLMPVGGGIAAAGIGTAGSVALGMATGGVMTDSGPASLPVFARAGGGMSIPANAKRAKPGVGGVASGPHVSLFGEAGIPEAYVPMPNGKSVAIRMGKDGKAFLPLPSGQAIPAHLEAYAKGGVSGGGGTVPLPAAANDVAANSNNAGGVNVSTTVNFNGNGGPTDPNEADRMGRMISKQVEAAVIDVLQKQKKPGGVLNSSGMNSY